jgi:ribosomal protein S18 acetylase RimI-like enzyme
LRFEILDAKKHDRKSFDCGVTALNHYLQRFANQDQKRSLTKVYVLLDQDIIIGYYTLSAHSVLRDDLPVDTKSGSYGEVPFLLLGRLAIDKRYQGKGFGDMLIVHAFKNTRLAAEKIGILGIIVDAKDDKASSFYEGFGFKKLCTTKNRLVLPIGAIPF